MLDFFHVIFGYYWENSHLMKSNAVCKLPSATFFKAHRMVVVHRHNAMFTDIVYCQSYTAGGDYFNSSLLMIMRTINLKMYNNIIVDQHREGEMEQSLNA